MHDSTVLDTDRLLSPRQAADFLGLTADSEGSGPLIPKHVDHPFRGK